MYLSTAESVLVQKLKLRVDELEGRLGKDTNELLDEAQEVIAAGERLVLNLINKLRLAHCALDLAILDLPKGSPAYVLVKHAIDNKDA